ncbi:hypothetical protein [Bacillus benzoevorans]|uniref:Uncharacterized protein n=1 Tax=Bacillus benzoevorans TaxID=1456 RepID=A0A7X0HVL4_9BACI|nr:hypothetical protein [Bacillus benzoevorans]MBB6446435.1 hypothetical protein [Bacillus benzoevorans]
MIKSGDKQNFIYIPGLKFIPAGETPADAIERINRAEVEKEIADKKMLKQLQKEFPGREIIQCGSSWIIKAEE